MFLSKKRVVKPGPEEIEDQVEKSKSLIKSQLCSFLITP